MPLTSTEFDAQRRGWATLRSLRAGAVDLARVELLRTRPLEELRDLARLDGLLLELGLNDEGTGEFPQRLHPFCGGLRVWQYPVQFAPYLLKLSSLRVRSYVEIGVRHGGSFVATTEYLDRIGRLDFAVAVDVLEVPSFEAYREMNARAQLWCVDSRTDAFRERLEGLGSIDLVFIDSHHEEAQCRSEVELLLGHAEMIALHDITNLGCPGVGRVWNELRTSGDHVCFEFVEQYDGMGPFMGIGLAVRRRRLATAGER
jgi:hypothetical protein